MGLSSFINSQWIRMKDKEKGVLLFASIHHLTSSNSSLCLSFFSYVSFFLTILFFLGDCVLFVIFVGLVYWFSVLFMMHCVICFSSMFASVLCPKVLSLLLHIIFGVVFFCFGLKDIVMVDGAGNKENIVSLQAWHHLYVICVTCNYLVYLENKK